MDYAKILPLTHAKYFRNADLVRLIKKVEEHPEDAEAVASASLPDPYIGLLLSVVVGVFGVDRFYNRQVILGGSKLLTLGGMGFWWLIDIFLIMNAIKVRNYHSIMQTIGTK